MTEPNLDKLLAECGKKAGTGNLTYGQIQAVKAIVDNQVREARLDERSQAQQYLHGLTITPESQHLFDVLSRDNHNRIVTLKGDNKGVNNEDYRNDNGAFNKPYSLG